MGKIVEAFCSWGSPRVHVDRRAATNLALRCLSIFAMVVSLVLSGVSAEPYRSKTIETAGGAWVISLVWNIVWIVRTHKMQALEPKWIIGIDCVLMLWYIAAVSIAGVYLSMLWYNLIGPPTVSFIFLLVAIGPHLWLMVHGCIAEHQRRNALRASIPISGKAPAQSHVADECTDCHGPIEPRRCAHCKASRSGAKPPSLGQGVVDEEVRASLDSAGRAKQAKKAEVVSEESK